MKILAKVKPNAKEERVEKISEREFLVRVKAPAQEGKANAAVIKLLSAYFDVPKSSIVIQSGQRGKNKIIVIS